MRVGKPAEEVERVDPDEGKIRIGKDESQERYVDHNPMTPLDINESVDLLERLRVGRRSNLEPKASVGAYVMRSTPPNNVQPASVGSGAGSGSGDGGGG